LNLEKDNWKDKVKKFVGNQNLDQTYAVGVSFKGVGKYPDGNPFVGGNVDKSDKNVYEGGLRELKEEIGVGLKKDCKTETLINY